MLSDMRPCICFAALPLPRPDFFVTRQRNRGKKTRPAAALFEFPRGFRPISDTRATGHPYPDDAGFSFLKIRPARPHPLGAAEGGEREEPLLHFFKSVLAREHRKPCGLAQKGA